MTLQRIYNLVLRFFPREYRSLFGSEMSVTFGQAARERCRGGLAALGFVFREMAGLGLAAAHEWVAKIAYSVSHSANYIDGGCLPNPLLMRAPGVPWLQHYRWDDGSAPSQCAGCGVDTVGSRDCDEGTGWSGNSGAFCQNAYQTFVLASPFRRLVILILGYRRCGHHR